MTALTVSDRYVANELWFQNIRGFYEFLPGFTAEVQRTGVEPLNLVIIRSHYTASSLRYLGMCGRLKYILFCKLSATF